MVGWMDYSHWNLSVVGSLGTERSLLYRGYRQYVHDHLARPTKEGSAIEKFPLFGDLF